MTAKDSKSTPKKAEDATTPQPRHPLALLAELERILPRVTPGPYHHDASATDYITARPGGVEHTVAVVRTTSSPETGDLLALSWEMAQALQVLAAENAALRAQAEAEAGLRAALVHYAELRHYDHAGRLWSGDPDEHEDAQVDFGEIARAALAQAGGES